VAPRLRVRRALRDAYTRAGWDQSELGLASWSSSPDGRRERLPPLCGQQLGDPRVFGHWTSTRWRSPDRESTGVAVPSSDFHPTGLATPLTAGAPQIESERRPAHLQPMPLLQ
jgi:hypothetical protein